MTGLIYHIIFISSIFVFIVIKNWLQAANEYTGRMYIITVCFIYILAYLGVGAWHRILGYIFVATGVM